MPDPATSADFTLRDLEARLRERATAPATESYTRKLLDKGAPHCAKKFGEEAAEAIIAAVSDTPERLASEAADVLYHLLVLLAARGVPLAAVEAELAARTGQSGLEEKAARPSG